MLELRLDDIGNISVMHGDHECGSIDMFGLEVRAKGPVRFSISRRENGVYPWPTTRGMDWPRVAARELTYADADYRTPY